MLEAHPSPAEFEEFLKPRSWNRDRARDSKVIRHLLSGCTTCRARLRESGWSEERLLRLLQFPAREPPEERRTDSTHPGSPLYNYDSAFARAEKILAAFLRDGKPVDQPPPHLLAELLPQAFEASSPSTFSPARPEIFYLVRWLIERSHASRYQDPEQMLHWAHIARLAVDAVTPEDAGGELRLEDLKGEAWRQFGNALRVCGRLQESAEALAQARHHTDRGTGDPLLKARLLHHFASLEIYQRRFEVAISLAEQSGETFQEIGETNTYLATQVQKATAHLYAGRSQDAIDILEEVIPQVDIEADPYLLLAARHNLVIAYSDLGEAQKALSLYFSLKELKNSFEDPMIRLRVSWVEGQLLHQLGHLEQAETALLKARRGFIERGLAYDVAMISFDLASVYAKLGRLEETREIVSDTVPIFRALRIGRETLAALIQLKKMAQPEPEGSG